MTDKIKCDHPLGPVRGRGTSSNPRNRFEQLDYELDLDAVEEDPEGLDRPRPETLFLKDRSRSILSKNDSPDIPYRFAINPYRGCEHGCVYCYARPGHEYLGMSSGIDFETNILVKHNAPSLLKRALSRKSWTPQIISMSSYTDCYQPVERHLKITRQCLEVFLDFRNPVGVITKNALLLRDIDLLRQLNEFYCVSVGVSITTLDTKLCRVLEPRTSPPSSRLRLIQTLTENNIPVGVNVAPVMPGLTDHEIPLIVEKARAAGARSVNYTMLRLPWAVAPLFERWLEHHVPGKKEKVLNRIRSMRGGKLYDATFCERMRGEGVFADQVETLFMVAKRKAGFPEDAAPLSTDHFRVPYDSQMNLFDSKP